MNLQHLHLPHLTPYTQAATLQSTLVRRFLDAKASPSRTPKPSPTILTFTPPPTYTCGRREISRLSAAQIAHLRADSTASFHEALRGGQTTYHGPGQVVGYLIADLKEHGLSGRSYVQMLEDSVIGLCARFGVEGMRTKDPGVWTRGSEGNEKVCALGVHLRRNIAAHGVGFNVGKEVLWWFDRIVACGLEGKGATCLEKEGIDVSQLQEETVPNMFVEEMAKRLSGVDGIDNVSSTDVASQDGGTMDAYDEKT